ncbi:MAG TPA: catalase family peroxidase [Steroidobacteraceae bacterium]|nr:catalase family peroxidase [Steroidobacteraceae bacterium]
MHSARPFRAAVGGAFPAARAALALALGAIPVTLVATLAAIPVAFAADSPPADQKPLPVALVNALNTLAGGPHAGFRANHAKGVLVTGTFTPAKTAPSFSSAPHFAKAVPVLVRFSDTTGVPTIPDASPDASPHGMAIRFKLPAGGSTDIVSISANGFPVGTPEDFLALLTAISKSGPGVPKPTPVEQFLGTHPAALKFVSTPKPPPQSFGTLAFFGVNAFKFTNAKGVSHFARYQILPVAGEHALTAAEAAKADPNYLIDELPKRLASPVKFRLVAQVAKEGDVTNDATAVWPPDREIVELGVISLTATEKEQAKEQKALLYNPLSLTSGIEASADPILAARPPAYAVSFAQRAGQ